jgi:hypothetical protein
MTLKLIIGNKNYSSWSMRPWIAMKAAGIRVRRDVISLLRRGQRGCDPRAFAAGKVPILIDGQGDRDARVGIARDHRISGGEISRRAALAVRSGGTGACPRDLDRDACGASCRCASNAA